MPVDAAAWTTLAAVREQLHVPSTDLTKDAFITSLINRSYKILETYLSRKIKSATYTEYYDGEGEPELLLNQFPIVSITSVHDDLDRDFFSPSEIPVTDLVLYKERGIVRLGSSAPSEQGVFQAGSLNVKIVYVAGYDPIPGDLEDACIQMIEHMHNRSNTGGFLSSSLGGRSESYNEDQIPAMVKRTLQAYRKRGHGTWSS